MGVIADLAFIEKSKCIDNIFKCAHLKIREAYSPLSGIVYIYACTSEDDTCCGCCRDMVILEKYLE